MDEIAEVQQSPLDESNEAAYDEEDDALITGKDL